MSYLNEGYSKQTVGQTGVNRYTTTSYAPQNAYTYTTTYQTQSVPYTSTYRTGEKVGYSHDTYYTGQGSYQPRDSNTYIGTSNTHVGHQRVVADQIPVQSRIQYIPFEKKYIEYDRVQRIERIPYERQIIEYEQVTVNERVPVQRTITDYYAVETQVQYIPRQIQETIVEYEPIERTYERIQYLPVQTQIVHYPQREKYVGSGSHYGGNIGVHTGQYTSGYSTGGHYNGEYITNTNYSNSYVTGGNYSGQNRYIGGGSYISGSRTYGEGTYEGSSLRNGNNYGETVNYESIGHTKYY